MYLYIIENSYKMSESIYTRFESQLCIVWILFEVHLNRWITPELKSFYTDHESYVWCLNHIWSTLESWLNHIWTFSDSFTQITNLTCIVWFILEVLWIMAESHLNVLNPFLLFMNRFMYCLNQTWSTTKSLLNHTWIRILLHRQWIVFV